MGEGIDKRFYPHMKKGG
ncbi:hypothetical protein SPV_2528 [Streptococcus pneumoniae]|nr:hypothetical protein SPV_2528 [Streptococcus pneumoniae]